MAEIIAPEGPIAHFAGGLSPTIVGTNDGTIWTDNEDATYTALPNIGSVGSNVKTELEPLIADVSAARITARLSVELHESELPPELQLPQRFVWNLNSDADDFWTVGSSFFIPTEGDVYDFVWTFATDDPIVFYGGAAEGADLSTIIGWLERDLAAGLIWMDCFTNGFPGSATITVYEFQLHVITGVSVVRKYPRDDGLGHSSGPRKYPPVKANRIIGGYQ